MKHLFYIGIIILDLTLFAGFILFNELYLQPKKSDLFVNREVVGYLRDIKRGVLNSSRLTIESKHRIVGLDRTSGIMTEYGIPYRYRFLVTIEDGKQADVYVTEEELPSTEFLIREGETEKMARAEDFQIGDRLLLERVYDYSVTGDFHTDRVRTKITKLVN